MAIIKKSTKNKCWRRCGERESSCVVGGGTVDIATVEYSMETPLKTTNKTNIWPSNPTAGHIPWENHNLRKYCSSIYNSQDIEATQMSTTDEWIKQLWYLYTMEYYSALKRNEFESVEWKWMYLEPVTQSEISQKKKNTCCVLMNIYGI